MKLAEALQERADLNRRVEDLQSRLERNATVQEGEQPAEAPDDLLRELDACIARFETLVAAINRTNAEATADGMTLTALIARKDALTRQLAVYRSFLGSASSLSNRYSRTEIKIKSTVDVRALQKKVDDLSRQLRLTDNALQQANWTVELIE